MKDMKAVVVTPGKAGSARLEEVPKPLVTKGQVLLKGLITSKYKLGQIGEALEAMEENIKVVIEF